MEVRASVRTGLAVLTGMVLSACGGTAGVGSPGGDCVSHYNVVATAPSWVALKNAMLGYEAPRSVASVRTQARGHDLGAGNQDVVRVVDLLNRNGRRLVQVDVWRTQTGAWRAGVWNQCID